MLSRMKNFSRGFIALITLSLTACGSGEEAVVDEVHTIVEPTQSLDEVRMLTVPAPLQIASVLRNLKAPYDYAITATPHNVDNLHSSNERALNLGIYIVDAGYSGLNEDYARSSEIFKKCLELSDLLGISLEESDNLMARFEDNRENVDSMSYIILETYDRAGIYFAKHDKEALALTIMCGLMVESIYFSSLYEGYDQDNSFYAMFTQEKVYLENLIFLMDRFSDDETMVANQAILK